MTFETTGTRGVCARVRSGRPRRTQAIPHAADVVGDIQSPHTGNVLSGVPHGEVIKKSRVSHALEYRESISIQDRCAEPSGSCAKLFSRPIKCLVPASGNVRVSRPVSECAMLARPQIEILGDTEKILTERVVRLASSVHPSESRAPLRPGRAIGKGANMADISVEVGLRMPPGFSPTHQLRCPDPLSQTCAP